MPFKGMMKAMESVVGNEIAEYPQIDLCARVLELPLHAYQYRQDKRGWTRRNADEERHGHQDERNAQDFLGKMMIAIECTHFSEGMVYGVKSPHPSKRMLRSMEPVIEKFAYGACYQGGSHPTGYPHGPVVGSANRLKVQREEWLDVEL